MSGFFPDGFMGQEEPYDAPLPEVKDALNPKTIPFFDNQNYNNRTRTLTTADLSDYFLFDNRVARALFKDQHILLIGDSIMRGIYKDLIAFLQTGELVSQQLLSAVNETSCYGDRQIDILPLEKEKVFRMAREWQNDYHLIQFVFTSRVMRSDLDRLILMLTKSQEYPDVVIMNSSIWDLTRYHMQDEQDVFEEHFERLAMFLRRMKVLLPPHAQFIWLILPWHSVPIEMRGFQAQHKSFTFEHFQETRMKCIDANFRVAQIVREAGFDVLDMSFYFRNFAMYSMRITDGVHWNNVAVRFKTQLILGHIIQARDIMDEVLRKMDISPDDLIKRRKYFEAAMEMLNRDGRENTAETKQKGMRRRILEKLHPTKQVTDLTKLTYGVVFRKCKILTTIHAFRKSIFFKRRQAGFQRDNKDFNAYDSKVQQEVQESRLGFNVDDVKKLAEEMESLLDVCSDDPQRITKRAEKRRHEGSEERSSTEPEGSEPPRDVESVVEQTTDSDEEDGRSRSTTPMSVAEAADLQVSDDDDEQETFLQQIQLPPIQGRILSPDPAGSRGYRNQQFRCRPSKRGKTRGSFYKRGQNHQRNYRY